MNNNLDISKIPAEIWNMLDGFLPNSNLIKFLLLLENKVSLQLDKWKLEYLGKRRNPKIHWMSPNMYYPNIKLGIPYIEIDVISPNLDNSLEKKYQKKIEYLPDTIIEEIYTF